MANYNYFKNQDDLNSLAEYLAISGLVKKGIKRENFCTDDDVNYEMSPDEEKASDLDFNKSMLKTLDEQKRRKHLYGIGSRTIAECKRNEVDIDFENLERIVFALQPSSPITVPNSTPEENDLDFPDGWDLIDYKFLDSKKQEFDKERIEEFLVDFFNGAYPQWAEILASVKNSDNTPRIHTRKNVDAIVKDIEEHRDCTRQHMILLIDSEGEGKSTILKQVCARIGYSTFDYKILFSDRPQRAKLNGEFLDSLRENSRENWLIIVDEAVDSIENMVELSLYISRKRYTGYQFLLAANSFDWTAARMELDKKLGSSPADRKEFDAGNINLKEARKIIESWYEIENKKRGMGALYEKTLAELKEETGKTEFTAGEVINTAAEIFSSVSRDGGLEVPSFYGAIFELRIRDILNTYIPELIGKLQADKRKIEGKSLIDIYAYIIALHADNFDKLTQTILAKVLGIETEYILVSQKFWKQNKVVATKIIPEFGKEAALSSHKHYVLSRHPAIARAAKDYLKEKLNYNFDMIIVELAYAGWEFFKETKLEDEDEDSKDWKFGLARQYPDIAIEIMKAVWQADKGSNTEIPTQDREMKLLVWQADKSSSTEILMKLSSLMRHKSQKLKDRDMILEASDLYHNEAEMAEPKDRAFYNEWSHVEAIAGLVTDEIDWHYKAVWLAAVAISDSLKRYKNGKLESEPMDKEFIIKTFTNLAKEFPRLKQSAVYSVASGACASLGLKLNISANSQEFSTFTDALRVAKKQGYKSTDSLSTQLEFVENAIRAAFEESDKDALPAWVPRVDTLSFKTLENFFVKLPKKS